MMLYGNDLSEEDAIAEAKKQTVDQGTPFNLWCCAPVNSTLLIFDVYRKIASASFPPAVRAVAIDEGDGESSEPDLDGTVRIKLEWSYVTEGVAPPKEFRLVVMKIVKAFFVEAIQKKREL